MILREYTLSLYPNSTTQRWEVLLCSQDDANSPHRLVTARTQNEAIEKAVKLQEALRLVTVSKEIDDA